jgi:hypothetical protein
MGKSAFDTQMLHDFFLQNTVTHSYAISPNNLDHPSATIANLTLETIQLLSSQERFAEFISIRLRKAIKLWSMIINKILKLTMISSSPCSRVGHM